MYIQSKSCFLVLLCFNSVYVNIVDVYFAQNTSIPI
jgi:hypothetical protein